MRVWKVTPATNQHAAGGRRVSGVGSWAKVTAGRRPEHASKISLAGTLGGVTIIIGQPVSATPYAPAPDTRLLRSGLEIGSRARSLTVSEGDRPGYRQHCCRRCSFCACAHWQVLKTCDPRPANAVQPGVRVCSTSPCGMVVSLVLSASVRTQQPKPRVRGRPSRRTVCAVVSRRMGGRHTIYLLSALSRARRAIARLQKE